MNYKENIVELLNIYLERNKELKIEYEILNTKKALYEELIPMLDDSYDNIIENKLSISILLNTIYGNSVYLDFYNKLINKDIEKRNKEIKEFINEIKNDYNQILNEIEELRQTLVRSKNTVSSANRVILCFKQNLPIIDTKYDVTAVKRIINYFEIEGKISNKEELLYINEMELYNRRLTSEKENNPIEKEYTESLYREIPNILNSGYEKYTLPTISEDRRKTLDKYIKNITSIKSELDADELLAAIENYKKNSKNDTEYEYIIINVMNTYLEELYTLYELLIDKEVYQKRKDRLEIIRTYYNELNTYLTIRKYYSALYDNEKEIIETDNEEDLPDVRKVIYACTDLNPTKARIITDLDNIPHEYYQDIYDIIMRFKKGTLAKDEYKSLKNSDTKINSCKELKNDQIRIIFKHIKDNVYVIVGVFVKKDNNDLKMYRSMSRRNIPKIVTNEDLELSLALGEKIDEELATIAKEKGRKGNR